MAAIDNSLATGTARLSALTRRRYMRLKLPPAVVLVPAILVGLAMLLPLTYLVIRSIGASDEAWRLLFRVQTVYTLGRTVTLIATVSVASVLIAVPIAWLTVRTDLPFRRVWTVLTVLPLVIPSFVGAFLMVSALGPKGLLQQFLSGPFGIDRLPEIYGLPGATLTLALLSYPYVLLTVRSALVNLDPAMEESARGLGHGPLRIFWKVTLPQLRPSIAAGSLLVGLYTLSDFGAVSLMRFPTFTSVIYQQLQYADRSIAAVLSLVLVGMAVVILVSENVSRGRLRYYQANTSAPRVPRVFRLGRWKGPSLAFCGGIVIFALVIPMAVLGFWLIRGVSSGEPLLLLWEATRNSLLVSGLAAIAAVVLSVPVAAMVVRHPSVLSRILEPVSFTGYALPGVVIALTLVFFGANYARPVYQTAWLLIFAYVVLFFPVALGAVRSSLQQISPKLEDAARGLGRRPHQVMLTVTLPLMRSGVIMGAALVFLITMKELPATLILGPLGFKTLATSIWSASSEAFFARAAAPALMLILISSVPMAFLLIRERRARA